MGALEQTVKEAIEKIAKLSGLKEILIGTAIDVGERTCTVEREGAPTLFDVRLNSNDAELDSFLTVYPANKSTVIVAIIEGLKTEAVVLKCSKIDKIKFKIGDQSFVADQSGQILNGGSYGGMIRKDLLAFEVNKINASVATLKAATSAALLSLNVLVPGISATFEAATATMQSADLSNVTNEKIKHG